MATKKITFDPDADSSPEPILLFLVDQNFHGDFDSKATNFKYSI